MRKTFQGGKPTSFSLRQEAWLDLCAIATAELSSEDPEHPLENALALGADDIFRAAEPGTQFIQLSFDQPQTIRQIRLEFEENDVARTQEFALFSTSSDGNRQEVIRQQWTFSPGGSTKELEEYTVDLQRVISLELVVDPGRHDKNAFVTLKAMRLA